MSHEFETGFFTKTPAWHGLGTVLDAPPTIAEALKLAGLDWTISMEQCQLADGTKVDRWATRRDTDKRVLGTVGPVWQPLQNATAFEWFQPIVDSGLASLEAAGSLRKGARVWILARVNAPADVIVDGDVVERFILLAHGHDGSLAIRAGLTPIRVVCQNTLSAAIGGNELIRIFHTGKTEDNLAAARDIIVRANGAFDKAAEAFRALAEIKNIGSKQLRAYVDAVFPKTKTKAEKMAEELAEFEALMNRPLTRESTAMSDSLDTTAETKSRIYKEIERLFETGTGTDIPGVKGTAWGAYNAVTEYLTHERGRSDENRLNTVFWGAEGGRAISGALEVFLQKPVSTLAAA